MSTALRRIIVPVTAKLVTGSEQEKRTQAGNLEARLSGLEDEIDALQVSDAGAASVLSNRAPSAVDETALPGTGTKGSRDDHVHPGVMSIALYGEEAIQGAVVLVAEGSVTIEVIDDEIHVSAPELFEEAPVDQGDHINYDFSVAYTTFMLHYDGVLMREGNDFTYAAPTVTFVSVREDPSLVTAWVWA